jgi:hypothetical protein
MSFEDRHRFELTERVNVNDQLVVFQTDKPFSRFSL